MAEKEASAWEGFAGAVDDHEEAATALRKAERLLVGAGSAVSARIRERNGCRQDSVVQQIRSRIVGLLASSRIYFVLDVA